MLLAFQFIPCSNLELCNEGVIENSISAFYELTSNGLQLTFTILLLPLVCFYNTSGTSVTAYGSAAARCTIEQLRNLLVWVYFMVIRVNGKCLESFTWLQLFGFVILLFGILVFNELIVLPIFKMDKTTRSHRHPSESGEDRLLKGSFGDSLPVIGELEIEDDAPEFGRHGILREDEMGGINQSSSVATSEAPMSFA